MDFERRLPTEQADIADITAGILTVQGRYARQQKRPLGRGTHTKGVCVRATFEVLDVAAAVGSPALAARLARGLFAKPGTYQAKVRFANAASRLQPDSTPDVRALSFAVEVPAGVLGPQPVRLDYSMNNAPTFPINDAHAFAAFMRVQGTNGLLGTLRGLFSLSFADMKGFVQTAVRGVKQQRQPLRSYQQLRYWSNVAFLHGDDEAIKYSAIPAPDNAGGPLGKGDTVLRDDLLRHVNEDAPQPRWDFALQLLEPSRMTDGGGRTREASYWVENASVEWPEAQAPFHTVARLTLVPQSQLPQAECEAWSIDVTEHALAGHRPIGSINRARWVVEAASRKARLAAASVPAAPKPSLVQRLAAVRLGSIVKAAALALGAAGLLAAAVAVVLIVKTNRGDGMLPPDTIDRVVYPDQGWGAGVAAAGRQTYYYTAQGAQLKELRYRWFTNLEMPWSKTKISSPQIMRRYGFVVDGVSKANPDGLPVGFARAYDTQLNEPMLDITCAACHTGQINVTRNGRTTALRIDGGSALHAFTSSEIGHFVPTLEMSIVGTLVNPMKFSRFANAVLGPGGGGRWVLRRQMLGVAGQLAKMAFNEKWYHLVPTVEGYGRTDALARIANTVFGDHIQASNYAVGNAPVNYPPVWNIWKFDWVQYNASVSQPMARNIGETMGTGAKYALLDRYGRPLPADERYRSTALLDNLHTIEIALRKLRPPAWNEDVLGPVNRELADRGKTLFDQHCVACHGPHIAPPAIKTRNSPLKGPADPEWLMKTLCWDDIGTDPNTALNFYDAKVDLTKTGLTAEDLRAVARRELAQWNDRQRVYLQGEIARLSADPATAAQAAPLQRQLDGLDAAMEQALSEIDPSRLSVGAGLSYVGMLIREKAYADKGLTQAQQDEMDGFAILDIPEVIPSYKPRPLAGVWATPPYLHNGSVPTIYDLLSPVSERPKTFRVGSREFDPVKLGLKQPDSGYWIFDTSLDGNHNTGHEFNTGYKEWKEGDPPSHGLIGPLLTPDERLAIIEHLKVRNDDLDGPQTPSVPAWATCSAPTRSDAGSRYVR